MTGIAEIRPSPIVGTWYEARPERLAGMVDNFIETADLPALEGQPVAVIAPHAGHVYSGAVAGYAFAAVRQLEPEVVAVVAPMHHPYHQPLLTTAHAAYATPLGQILVNRELLKQLDGKLVQRLGLELTPVVNDPEHSLEIELPFLQRAVKSTFTLLPVMLRAQSREVSRHLGQALAEVLSGKKALLVASSDLSHFYNQTIANELDAAMLGALATFSPEALFDVERNGQGEACGLGAMAAVLWAAKGLGAGRVQVLKHATSGDVTHEYQRVVGYGAAVALKVN